MNEDDTHHTSLLPLRKPFLVGNIFVGVKTFSVLLFSSLILLLLLFNICLFFRLVFYFCLSSCILRYHCSTAQHSTARYSTFLHLHILEHIFSFTCMHYIFLAFRQQRGGWMDGGQGGG
ncbi:hypothetical protein B0J18DRAFT_199583 [Chaetomium sp. MPI-SDFR-AT-0129]|nr:hypothetical protein B0J18DRAFT_199583 [Chaetomium sp. MPI-SDFR-AT-0129]